LSAANKLNLKLLASGNTSTKNNGKTAGGLIDLNVANTQVGSHMTHRSSTKGGVGGGKNSTLS
jgi:hypothetical protein